MLAGARPGGAAVTITDDPGGRIGTYIHKFEAVRRSGERVIVAGTCSSACTMLLGIIPRNRTCVTPAAVFQFHTAWDLSPGGGQIASEAGNRILWSRYPPDIRSWISQHGGLGEGVACRGTARRSRQVFFSQSIQRRAMSTSLRWKTSRRLLMRRTAILFMRQMVSRIISGLRRSSAKSRR